MSWNTLITNDIISLQKILMPKELKSIMEYCIMTAKEFQDFDASKVYTFMISYKIKDDEVEAHLKRIGLKYLCS